MADTVAYVRSVEQLVIDTLADLGLSDAGRLRDYPGVWVDPESERPAQDRRHRRAAHPRPVDARLRSQRRPGHGDVRPHRAVRHPRQGRSRRSPRRASTSRCTRWSTLVAARARRRWAASGRSWERADVVWRDGIRTDADLSPFSRGLGPGTVVRTAADHGIGADASVAEEPVEVAVAGPSLRLRGRLAEAGVADGSGHLHPQARVAAGPGLASGPDPSSSSAPSATSAW